MADTLSVEIREALGKRYNRRLRQQGKIPAILYGHGEAPVCLEVRADQFAAVVRHGSRMVYLKGALDEQAFIRECQWDTWGSRVLHVDLTRVSAREKVTVSVPVELRGDAPGVKEGGIINHQIHALEIECPANAIPDKFEVNINELNLGDSIGVGVIELPRGATTEIDENEPIVTCTHPVETPEEAEEAAGEEEPEIIGRAKEDEEGEDEA